MSTKTPRHILATHSPMEKLTSSKKRRMHPERHSALALSFKVNHKALWLAAVASALAGAFNSAEAAAPNWKTAGDGNWTDTAKWSTALTGATDTITFNASGQNLAETIYLNGNQTAASLTFSNTGTTKLLGGVSGTPAVNTFTLGSGGITLNAGAGAVTIGDTTGAAAVNLTLSAGQNFANNSSSLLTIANGVTSAAANTLTLTGSGLGGMTFAGSIGGSLAVTVTTTVLPGGSTGVVTFSGVNSYTGATKIQNGATLSVNASTDGGNYLGTGAISLGVASNNGGPGTLTATSGATGTYQLGTGAITSAAAVNTKLSLASTGNANVNFTSATAAGATFALGGVTNLALNSNGGSGSLTYTIGNTGAAANSVLTRTANSGVLVISPSALANLGSTEKFIINGQSATSASGIFSPYVIAQDTAANGYAGDFVNYTGSTNGFKTASNMGGIYVDQSTTGLDTQNSATAIFNVNQNVAALTANRQVNSLKVGSATTGYTLDTGGKTLTLGNGTMAGLILNGNSTIGVAGSAGTLAFGAAEAIVYTASNSTINSAVTTTGYGGLTLSGPGTLTLDGDGSVLGNLGGTGNLKLDGSATVGNGTNMTYGGVLSGTGSITKMGNGTTTLTGSNIYTYSGDITVNQGTLATGVSYDKSPGSFFSTGSLTVGPSGTFSVATGGNGGGAIDVFSGLYGTGSIIGGNGTRAMAINYNGAATDVFSGTLSALAGGLIKNGVGTLQLTSTASTLASNGQLIVNWGELIAPSVFAALTGSNGGSFIINGGTLLLTGTSGSITGNSSSTVTGLNGGQLIIRPDTVSSTTDIALTGQSTAVSSSIWRSSGGTLVLDRNGNKSLTYTIGNTANSNTSSLATMNNNLNAGMGSGGGGSLIIAVGGNGLSELGDKTKLVVLESGATALNVQDTTLVNNGMVGGQLVGQNNDVSKSGGFLTYVGTHIATDTGFKAATYNTDANNASFYAGTTAATAIEDVTTNGSLSANTNVYALRVGGANDTSANTVVDLNGKTLTLGDSVGTRAAGLILNGGTITGSTGTLAFGASMGSIYVSAANGVIDGRLTGSGGLTVAGPGVLSLTKTAATPLSGGITVNGSTLDSAISTLGTNQLILKAGGVFQSNGAFTRSLGTGGSQLYFATTTAAGGSGGFAARGGDLTVLLNNSNATPLIWGTTANFLSETGALYFGSTTADSTVDFQNNLDLGVMGSIQAAGSFTRVINVTAGTGTDRAKISGNISSTNAVNVLAKDGNGTLVLAGVNSYVGETVVNAGSLVVSAGGSLASKAVTVASNSTLKIDGSVAGTVNVSGTLGGGGSIAGATTVNGTLAPGNSIGTISTGALTLGSNSIFDVELGRDGGSAISDRTNVTGSVEIISGADLKLTLYSGLATPFTNDIFYLIANDGEEAFNGVFTSLNGVDTLLSEGSQFSWNKQEWTITYQADAGKTSFTGGNDLAIMVVPEPSTWAMLVGGLGMLAFGSRCRRNRRNA